MDVVIGAEQKYNVKLHQQRQKMRYIICPFMKYFCLTLIITILACKHTSQRKKAQQPPEASKKIQIKLVDSPGNVTFSIPIRYDTSFTWTDHSDCGKPCDQIKYRWQSKKLPITKESGWIWTGEPTDSIERFTISHSDTSHFTTR